VILIFIFFLEPKEQFSKPILEPKEKFLTFKNKIPNPKFESLQLFLKVNISKFE